MDHKTTADRIANDDLPPKQCCCACCYTSVKPQKSNKPNLFLSVYLPLLCILTAMCFQNFFNIALFIVIAAMGYHIFQLNKNINLPKKESQNEIKVEDEKIEYFVPTENRALIICNTKYDQVRQDSRYQQLSDVTPASQNG